MRNRSLKGFVYVLLSLVVVMGVWVSFPRTTASARRLKNRTINRLPIERDRPIGIVGVKIRGNGVHPSRGFIEDDDWVEGLVIRIRNRSAKDILFASIDLQFPRPAGSVDPFAIDEITFGNRGLLSRLPTFADGTDRITPNQTRDLRLSAGQVYDIKSLLIATGYPSETPDDVDIRIGTVIFSDGTMWRSGTRFRMGSAPGEWVAEDDQLTTRSKTPVPRQANGPSFAFLQAGFSPTKTFDPFSSNVAMSCGKALTSTTNRPCLQNENCAVMYDWVSQSIPGDYFAASAMAHCKTSGESCNLYQSVVVANSCVGGSGGGGSGGHFGALGDVCETSWDCSAGYSCNDGSCGDSY